MGQAETMIEKWRRLTTREVESEYKEISDYAIIGDMRTCALVGIDGSIDWFCTPRFDSPSVFGALLDKKKGGRFSIRPKCDLFEVNQHYEDYTNILVTEFRTETGSFALTDFMPCFKVESAMILSGEIHRRLLCTSGTVDVQIVIQPRMNYGGVIPETKYFPGVGYRFTSDTLEIGQRLALLTSVRLDEVERGTLSSVVSLKKKKQYERLDLVLRHGGTRMDHPHDPHTDLKLSETRTFWSEWVSRARYSGRWRDKVLRSALALKLLVYAPTGAIVAAPTTSLPEEIGGVRNWDYRYSWIRDSSFVLWAFHSLGYDEEALSYLNWFMNSFYLSEDNVQIMLGVGGERDLSERSLDHLEGYRASSPLRVGNGAWEQFQLDLYGILLDALYFSHRHGGGIEKKMFDQLVKPLVNSMLKEWTREDCGIWEVRGKKKHFVYSKMWCWVALDRAVKIARALGLTDQANNWMELREKMHNEIINRGYDESIKSFVQSYGSKDLDAANLLMPQVRFLEATDPRIVSTIDRTKEKLMKNGKFVYRYLSDDGLPGREGAFLVCSFWLVNCLTMAGRLGEAEDLLDSLVEHSNHVGLFSEEGGYIDRKDAG
jgi:GH15 family glucan-1,4-alpha-glucosidase